MNILCTTTGLLLFPVMAALAQETGRMTLQEAVQRKFVTLEEATPSSGYSRFKFSLKNPGGQDVWIDPYGSAFQPPSEEKSQRVGLGLPLTIDGRPLNLRKPGQSSEPTDTIPPLNVNESDALKSAGVLAAGMLSLLGILAVGQMGGQSWRQDLSDFQDVISGFVQPPPPLEEPNLPASPDWPPATGTADSAGKIWCQPPWDKGGPYWMDPDEYQQMKSQQAAGKIWDDRNGWVSRGEQAQYQAASEANRLAMEAESRARAAEFAENQRQLDNNRRLLATQAEQSLQRDIATAVAKAQEEGFANLSDEDRDLLSQADEATKAELRGEPAAIKSYEKRAVEYLLSQKAIDNVAWGLDWGKSGADQLVGLIGAYGGTPGKIVGTSYTMLSNIAGSASEGIAQYKSGMSNAKTLNDAISAGAKKGAIEGVESVIIDEVVGRATKPLAGWLSGKANNLLNQSTTLKLTLFESGTSKGLSDGLLQQSMESELKNINTRVVETAEWAAGEGTKQLGKTIYEKYFK